MKNTPAEAETPYVPKRPASEEELTFKKLPMVRWMSPGELMRSGVKALLSSLFGAYADWREVQALRADVSSGRMDGNEMVQKLHTHSDIVPIKEVFDFSDNEEVWVDYVADLGDGFNATYSVARTLAEEELVFDGEDTKTKRGNILVMGGDQVYPTATRKEYQDRLYGPYEAALPYVPEEKNPPKLFAVPGNHDWYDGLTSFMRLFCQQRWIGGWKTEQKRSYFAIKLPGNWWIWGIDVQLASDIDLPQKQYFEAIARNSEPSSIILCTAEPTWAYTVEKGKNVYDNLMFFEKNIIHKHKHKFLIGLAGDLHTYARYAEEKTGKQRFISGGGGAYLYPTHQLPTAFETPVHDEDHPTETYKLQHDKATGEDALFPLRNKSRELASRAWRLPFLNWDFTFMMGAIYLLLAWFLQGSSKYAGHSHSQGLLKKPVFQEDTIMKKLAVTSDFFDVIGEVVKLFPHNIAAIILSFVLLFGLYKFVDHKVTWVKAVLGVAHFVCHMLLIILLMWLFSYFNLSVLKLPAESTGQVILFIIEMVGLGGILGGLLFGVYLVLSNLFVKKKKQLMGVHANEVFACQPNPDYKHFLRLHIKANGEVTIYPIGINKVYKKWTFNKTNNPEAPFFTGKEPKDMCHLIEKPVKVIDN